MGQFLGGDVGMLPFFQITVTAQPGPSEWNISEWGTGRIHAKYGRGGLGHGRFRDQISPQSDCERPDDFQCTADARAENTAYVKVLSDYVSANNYQYLGFEDTAAAPVPEPSTAVLISSLVLVAAERMRRRR